MKLLLISFFVFVGISLSHISYAHVYKNELQETVKILQGLLLDKKEFIFEKNKECARLQNDMYRDLHSPNSDYYEFKPKITHIYFSEDVYSCMYQFTLKTEEKATQYQVNYFSKKIEEK